MSPIIASRSALLLLAAAGSAAALQVTFPTADSNGYWVACQNNTLSWTSNSTDADIFSVALLNSNQKDLNGNYQIANSLKTSAGSAVIYVECVATGSYSVLLVNASNYELDHPQVYAQSAEFQLMPNGTALASPSSTSGSSSDAPSATDSASADAAATTAPSTGSSAAKNAAARTAGGATVALGATAVALASLGLAAALF